PPAPPGRPAPPTPPTPPAPPTRPAPPTPPTPPGPPARVGGLTALPGTETCERPGSPAGPPGARAKLPACALPAPAPQRFDVICDRLALMLLYRLTLTFPLPPPHPGFAQPDSPPTTAAPAANASPVASAV